MSVFAALLLFVASCQTAPPVQEMSDARQAIAVAREAGGAQYAGSILKDAEESLESAQRQLAAGAYSLARRDALQARNKALAALSIAERAAAQQPE